MGRTKTRLVHDANGQPIQGALSPRPGGSQDVTIQAATTLSVVISDAEIVRLLPTSDCRVRFGNETVEATATDMYLKANVAEYFSLRGNSKEVGATLLRQSSNYIAVIRVAVDGVLNIQIME